MGKKEFLLLNIIRYTPALLVLLISLSILIFTYHEHNKELRKEQIQVEKEYLSENKNQIKINLTTVANFVKNTIDDSEQQIKDELTYQINLAHTIVMSIYTKNKDTLSKDEIISQIKDVLGVMRFGQGKGYFSVHTMEGINILNPAFTYLEDTLVLNRQDASGHFPVQEALMTAKTKGMGFMSWYYFKPNDTSKHFKKIGIVKKFEPYNLVITTALFQDDFINNLKSTLLTKLKIFKYDNDEVIFVLDTHGKLLLTKTKYSNLVEVDKKNNFTADFNAFIHSKKENTFLQYPYYENTKMHRKISYLQKVDKLDWVIATGFDLDNLNRMITNKQKELEVEFGKHLQIFLITSIIISLFFLVISLFISKRLEKIFYAFQKVLIQQETTKFESIMKELNSILDNLPMIVLYKDTKDNIIRTNSAFESFFQTSVKKLSDISTKALFPDEYKKYYLEDLEVIKTKQAKLCIIETFTSSDGKKTFETSRIPIFNAKNEVQNIVVCMVDITQKLKQEQELKETTSKLYNQEIEKVNNYEQTIFSLVDLIEQRDLYTGGHSRRVADYAVMIAEKMDFNSHDIMMLKQIGLLHDIGKIAIPDSILLKPGKLTCKEYNIIKSHSLIGYNVISNISMFKKFSNIILYHHERYDGSGYPEGLKKDEIPTLAVVLSIADSFDAMTSSRIYNTKRSVNEALAELKKDSGRLFHPDIIKVALKALKNVNLSTVFSETQFPESPIEQERFSYFFKDPLTGFSNERYLRVLFKQDFHKFKCINLILVHNYSYYNKKFGWEKGNELLVIIAHLIQKYYPSKEFFRFHGVNFVLLHDKHIDLNLDQINIELQKYNVQCELFHFHLDKFDNFDTLIGHLNK